MLQTCYMCKKYKYTYLILIRWGILRGFRGVRNRTIRWFITCPSERWDFKGRKRHIILKVGNHTIEGIKHCGCLGQTRTRRVRKENNSMGQIFLDIFIWSGIRQILHRLWLWTQVSRSFLDCGGGCWWLGIHRIRDFRRKENFLQWSSSNKSQEHSHIYRLPSWFITEKIRGLWKLAQSTILLFSLFTIKKPISGKDYWINRTT